MKQPGILHFLPPPIQSRENNLHCSLLEGMNLQYILFLRFDHLFMKKMRHNQKCISGQRCINIMPIQLFCIKNCLCSISCIPIGKIGIMDLYEQEQWIPQHWYNEVISDEDQDTEDPVACLSSSEYIPTDSGSSANSEILQHAKKNNLFSQERKNI